MIVLVLVGQSTLSPLLHMYIVVYVLNMLDGERLLSLIVAACLSPGRTQEMVMLMSSVYELRQLFWELTFRIFAAATAVGKIW